MPEEGPKGRRFSGEVKHETLALIELTKGRTGWKLDRILRSLGITRNYPGASDVKPDVVSDNAAQFTSKDFKQLVRHFELEHIRIPTCHPESNGVPERFHRTTREGIAREEIADEELKNLAHAREIIARWVMHYNEERLHAGLDYLRPAHAKSAKGAEALHVRGHAKRGKNIRLDILPPLRS